MTAGAILVGGRSRRFGSDKARALWGTRTFLEHVAAAMRGAGLRPLFVVGDLAGGVPDGLEAVGDRWPGEGPLGGTISALLAHKGDMVVAACDLPRLTPGALLRLVEFAGPEPVVVPLWRESLQPVCALYRPAALVSLAEDFAGGERSLVGALAHLPIREVPFDDADLAFANINTPEDAARFLQGGPPGETLHPPQWPPGQAPP